MLDAALRTLDMASHIFTAFAYIGYSFFARHAAFVYVGYEFCASCADFAYVYVFGIHVVGLVRAIISWWISINVNYAALVAI